MGVTFKFRASSKFQNFKKGKKKSLTYRKQNLFCGLKRCALLLATFLTEDTYVYAMERNWDSTTTQHCVLCCERYASEGENADRRRTLLRSNRSEDSAPGFFVALSIAYTLMCDLCGRPNPTTSGANAAQISVGIYVCVYIWCISVCVGRESFFGREFGCGFQDKECKSP